VVLRQFALRHGSGGKGKFKGGDGTVRELQFTAPLVVSILSERRAFQPYGMAGGEPGQRGANFLTLPSSTVGGEGREISLGGKNTVDVTPGDRLLIMSPGGGGYGPLGDKSDGDDIVREKTDKEPMLRTGGGSLAAYTASQESV